MKDNAKLALIKSKRYHNIEITDYRYLVVIDGQSKTIQSHVPREPIF